MRIIAVLVLSLMPSLAFAGGATPTCAAPDAMSDGWSVASPGKEGLDPSLICSIGPSLEKLQGADPNGVVVVRHDTLVYEHYFATGGMEYRPDTLHDIRSITKGVVGLLVGIALDRGWLNSIDDRVFSYLPGDADLSQGKEGITLRGLLTMTSGLRV